MCERCREMQSQITDDGHEIVGFVNRAMVFLGKEHLRSNFQHDSCSFYALAILSALIDRYVWECAPDEQAYNEMARNAERATENFDPWDDSDDPTIITGPLAEA